MLKELSPFLHDAEQIETFWEGKRMVGPAQLPENCNWTMLHIIILHCRLLYDASHHHLTVQNVVCFTSSSYSADCCMLHIIILQCRMLYASHHHLTVQTVVWCFTSSSYSADCCMMLHIIILQCRLLYASHHHLTVQTVVWCFTSSSYSADCCMLHIIILQCRLLYDASHHHLTVQTVVWCFTSSSYSADCCMMLHIIILQCRLLYDASHHLTVQTVSFPTLSTSLGIFTVPPRSPKSFRLDMILRAMILRAISMCPKNTTWRSAWSPTVSPLSGRPKFSNRTHPFG